MEKTVLLLTLVESSFIYWGSPKQQEIEHTQKDNIGVYMSFLERKNNSQVPEDENFKAELIAFYSE